MQLSLIRDSQLLYEPLIFQNFFGELGNGFSVVKGLSAKFEQQGLVALSFRNL